MVQEIDKTARRIGCRAAVVARRRSAEMLAQQARQLSNGTVVARRAAGIAAKQQIIGERDPVARRHLEDLVPAVSIEGDERQRRL